MEHSSVPALVLGMLVATSQAAIPLPTPPQLLYQQHEIMALIHFNMATFAHDGDPGCAADNWNAKASYAAGPTSDPATFNPAKLNISNWAASMLALGAKHAVLTAKHGCGHLLWPTHTPLPDGREYTYCVGKEASAIKHDVLKEFSDTMQQNGIGHGFYYSLTNNFYLNVRSHQAQNGSVLPGQEKVTQEQFEAIALSQVSELWSQYGALTEIWFDGGYTSDLKDKITALLKSKQPNAAAFGGYGVSPNPICWVGTESGAPGGEVWSTGTSGVGDANSSVYCPKTCDTTLQEQDHWFFMPGTAIRTLKELIAVYHGTVGRNGMLELDFAINRDGLVEPAHAARYKEFGDWIHSCYDKPVAETSVNGTSVELAMPPGSPAVDRIILQEDLTKGQRVRGYRVEYIVGGKWTTFSSGHSIGNKRIDLGEWISGSWTKFRLVITDLVGTDGPYITKFAVYTQCPTGASDEVLV